MLRHLANHHHVRSEVLVGTEQFEGADVPVSDHSRVEDVDGGQCARIGQAYGERDQVGQDGKEVATVPLGLGQEDSELLDDPRRLGGDQLAEFFQKEVDGILVNISLQAGPRGLKFSAWANVLRRIT